MRRTLVSLFVLSVACADVSGMPPSDGIIVPDGKADDFLSLTGAEFVVSGRARVTLEESAMTATGPERMARLRQLAGYQQVAIAWFLNQYLVDKHDGDSNESYGGYRAMARANTYDTLDFEPTAEPGTYTFYFEQLVAGRRDLIDVLPTTRTDDGRTVFSLEIGTPTNEELARLETNHEWYRSSPWSAWNPDTVDPSRKTTLELTIRPEVASQDAWFDFPALVADGVMDIDVHMGWDYHDAYHVRHAEALFSWLVRRGFEAPVERFEELTRHSGPFTRTIRAGGQEVVVAVRIFYGAPGTETDPDTDEGGRALEEDVRFSLATRDVIIYSGHSGPFYGFALANWRQTSEGDLDDTEMREVEMPENRYQIVVAEGCDTYQIGEAFRNNPAKPDGRFIDVVTTTAPSNASSPATVQDVLAHLVGSSNQAEHDPTPIRALLRDLDRNSFGFHTMYGVHGIDDNPQMHPWADPTLLCEACLVDADCGGPGNRCVMGPSERRVCAPSCTTDAGCGPDARCRDVASFNSRRVYDAVCVPTIDTCG